MARVLHYFHITHTRAETHMDNSVQTDPWVSEEWQETRQIIESLQLEPARTRIYQDTIADLSQHGFQTIDQEYPQETALRYLKVSQEEVDFPNVRILIALVEKGCHLMVTECAEHLEVFMRIRQAMWKFNESETRRLFMELRELRDPFIAQQINRTLLPGDTGILFLGKDHVIADKLEEDIEVYDYHGNK